MNKTFSRKIVLLFDIFICFKKPTTDPCLFCFPSFLTVKISIWHVCHREAPGSITRAASESKHQHAGGVLGSCQHGRRLPPSAAEVWFATLTDAQHHCCWGRHSCRHPRGNTHCASADSRHSGNTHCTPCCHCRWEWQEKGGWQFHCRLLMVSGTVGAKLFAAWCWISHGMSC